MTDERKRQLRDLALQSYHEYDYCLHRVGLSEAVEELLAVVEAADRVADLVRMSAPLTWAATGDQHAAQDWERAVTDALVTYERAAKGG